MEIRDFQLERYFARHEFQVPHHLSASDCEPLTVKEVLESSGTDPAELAELTLGYTESQGDPALRREIARHYPSCTPDDVVVTNAPEEAIFLAMHALLKRGDRVVVQTPCYQSLLEVARSIGCDVAAWPLRELAAGWHLDLDLLDELLTPSTRLLVLNAPHNPTGHQPTAADRDRAMALAAARGVRVFSDEMYRGLEPRPELALAPAASRDDRALSLWGMSKSFGLAGLRIGWLACRDQTVIQEVLRLKDYTTICSSAPGELLARAALRCGDVIMSQHRERIARNAAAMAAFAADHGDRLAWLAPDAGPVGLARVLTESATQLCDRARERAGVLLLPSSVFDMDDRHVRFGLGREGLASALERLATAV